MWQTEFGKPDPQAELLACPLLSLFRFQKLNSAVSISFFKFDTVQQCFSQYTYFVGTYKAVQHIQIWKQKQNSNYDGSSLDIKSLLKIQYLKIERCQKHSVKSIKKLKSCLCFQKTGSTSLSFIFQQFLKFLRMLLLFLALTTRLIFLMIIIVTIILINQFMVTKDI